MSRTNVLMLLIVGTRFSEKVTAVITNKVQALVRMQTSLGSVNIEDQDQLKRISVDVPLLHKLQSIAGEAGSARPYLM